MTPVCNLCTHTSDGTHTLTFDRSETKPMTNNDYFVKYVHSRLEFMSFTIYCITQSRYKHHNHHKNTTTPTYCMGTIGSRFSDEGVSVNARHQQTRPNYWNHIRQIDVPPDTHTHTKWGPSAERKLLVIICGFFFRWHSVITRSRGCAWLSQTVNERNRVRHCEGKRGKGNLCRPGRKASMRFDAPALWLLTLSVYEPKHHHHRPAIDRNMFAGDHATF